MPSRRPLPDVEPAPPRGPRRLLLRVMSYRADPVADDGELARLWALADRVYPPHAASRAHAARSGRTIPLLQLTPRAR